MTSATAPDAILDAALALADEIGWPNVTARAIGARLGGGPDLVHAHFRDLNEVADAWFRRALATTLTDPADTSLPFADRLTRIFTRWLDALSPHRQASLDMIQAKLYPSHPHHWVPLVFNLSRLVQWMLDAAECPATGRRRQATEIAVSALVPAALWRWRRGDNQSVKDFVSDKIAQMENRFDRIWPLGSPLPP
ncbi:MAG: TetR family transcriptional regulator [Alphaproteobacteria bacterium]|nr:TetR family transcriptional regulator [Alphaproteobacteria bacterium]